MKKYFILMASAALMLAVSCNKEEVNTPATSNETELITVQINPETKTALGTEGTTTWDADDKVSVTVGGELVGTLSLVEGSTFSGEITAGLSGTAVLNYPADVKTVPATQTAVADSFADEAALLEGTTTVEDLRAGKGVELQNKTALLKFTVAQAGDVTFEVGTAKYTVTGCKTGETYYACVAPAEGVNLVARIDGYLSRATSKVVTFTASQIANLETLPAPVASNWKVMGQPSWEYANAVTMYKEYNMAVVKNLEISGGFKFMNGSDWLGDGAVTKNKVYVHVGNGSDMTIEKAKYDVYIANNTVMHESASRGFFFIVPAGTDLSTANLTFTYGIIGNNSNWNDDVLMTFDTRGYFVASNIKMSGSEFKVRADKAWTNSWGTGGKVTNSGSDIYFNGANSSIAAGTYDIYTDFCKIWSMSVGTSPAL